MVSSQTIQLMYTRCIIRNSDYMNSTTRRNHSSLIDFIFPLVVYEITFALYIVFHSQQDRYWFKIAYISMGISFIIALVKTFACYKKWHQVFSLDRKAYLSCLSFYFVSLLAYLICIFHQADQWYVPASPPVFIFVLLSIPPVIEFIIFLSLDLQRK
jgi:hypothetical protein